MVFLRWTIPQARKSLADLGWRTKGTVHLLRREGVYVFRNSHLRAMYVGRSLAIIDRIRSHLRKGGTSPWHNNSHAASLESWFVDMHFVDIPGASWWAEKALMLLLCPRFNERGDRSRHNGARATRPRKATHEDLTGTIVKLECERDTLKRRIAATKPESLFAWNSMTEAQRDEAAIAAIRTIPCPIEV